MSRQPHLSHQTQYTRTGTRDTANRKPYRTAAQKYQARQSATKINGTYVSTAPVSYHRGAKNGA